MIREDGPGDSVGGMWHDRQTLSGRIGHGAQVLRSDFSASLASWRPTCGGWHRRQTASYPAGPRTASRWGLWQVTQLSEPLSVYQRLRMNVGAWKRISSG
jgi:hypothetical protein